MRHYQMTVCYDSADGTDQERPQSRVPVDGPDADVPARVRDLLAAATAEGRPNPRIVLRCTDLWTD